MVLGGGKGKGEWSLHKEKSRLLFLTLFPSEGLFSSLFRLFSLAGLLRFLIPRFFLARTLYSNLWICFCVGYSG